jgi:hypothetical protein
MSAALRASLLFVLLAGCDRGAVSAPVVRVDLRARLPEKVLRRLVAADTTYECRKPFKLASGGAEQAFLASWRVLDETGERFITAVEINPDGPTRGAGSPTASALVEEIQKRREGKDVVGMVPVRVSWSASKGCGKVSAVERIELRADDPACVKPKGPGRLLVPVK